VVPAGRSEGGGRGRRLQLLLMLPQLALWMLLVSIPVGCITLTLTRSKAFEWLRIYIEKKRWRFFHALFSCPYCMSHWVTPLVMAVFPGRPGGIEVLGLCAIGFGIPPMATFWAYCAYQTTSRIVPKRNPDPGRVENHGR
jgi:hypothetical protein